MKGAAGSQLSLPLCNKVLTDSGSSVLRWAVVSWWLTLTELFFQPSSGPVWFGLLTWTQTCSRPWPPWCPEVRAEPGCC